MNIKLTFALLIAVASLNTPAFAQSGTVTFKGEITSPVCSGTLITNHISNASPETLARGMDNTGCEYSTQALVASAQLSQNDAPAVFAPAAQTTEQDHVEPVWTITYH